MKITSKKEIQFGNMKFFPSYNINFIYSENIYSGYLEGGPTVDDNERHIEIHKKRAKSLCNYLTPYLYTGNIDINKVLPYKGNI